jgi:hypothetical protein
MKSLNLSKLKKVSSDKDSTVFMHPDGHTIKVAHRSLAASLKKELDSLPVHKSNGGMINRYAEGTPDEPISARQNAPVVINVGATPQPQPSSIPNPSMAPSPQPVSPQQPPAQAVAPAPIQAPQIQKQAVPQEPPKEQTLAPDNVNDQAPQPVAQNDQAPQAAESSDQVPSQEYDSQPEAAPAAEQQPQAPMTYQDHYQTALQHYTSEDKAFENDLNNGHITPETYSDLFAKKSTLGKIGMIFGMMASGAGSGLSHQPNAMLTMMNNEIQNDLEAQKQSKANAQNLIKLNQQHQLNQAQVGLTGAQSELTTAESNTKALNLANMQMNRMALDKITQDVSKMPVGSPQRAQAEQSLAMLYNAVNNENFNIASRAAASQAYFKMLGQGASGAGNEQAFQNKTNGMRLMGNQGQSMAENLESKHMPGLSGQASVPLNGEDRDKISSGIAFDQKLERFIDWTKNHSGDLSPSDRNAGRALANELQGAYRQATHGGVYKEGEQNFISKIIDSEPTKFFNSVRVMPQLKALSIENKQRVDQFVKSKGFDGYKGSGSSEPQYKMYNGKKYMRGPNGEAIEVK